jgi:hypothetical protein
MRKTPYLAAAASAAFLVLAGCNNDPVTVNTPDSQAEALKNAPPAELPPSITANKAYRCADNSLFFVEFYSNNSAMIHRGSRDAAGTRVTGTAASGPFTGEGYTVSGSGDNVTINGKSCHT